MRKNEKKMKIREIFVENVKEREPLREFTEGRRES
jgi:hypothetical protein